jgi:DNA-binding response OmpR family regulator
MIPPTTSMPRKSTSVLPDTSLFARMQANGQRSLLVVDDDISIRRIMSAALQQAGYQVLTAADGEVAFDMLTRLAQNRRPLDALLLDLHMPGNSGLALLDRMIQAGMVLPTIAVTGDQDRQLAIELMRRGVGDLLDKPVRIDVLVATVNAFIQRTDLLAERRRAREVRLQQEMEELDRARRSTERKAQEASDSYYRLEAQVQSARTAWRSLTGLLIPPPGVALAWRNQPLADMGGDFIGLRATERGCLLLVADVAGHDMGASLHGVLIKAFFEENCREGLAGEEFMRRLNRQLVQSTEQRRLVTAQLIDLDLARHQATVVSAGHPAVLHQHGLHLAQVAGEGGVLGIVENLTFIPAIVTYGDGDRLFVCTDGVIDLTRTDGPSGARERFGLNGLTASLLAAAKSPLEPQIEATWQTLTQFCRRKPSDDMLLVGLALGPEADEYAPSEPGEDDSDSSLRPTTPMPPSGKTG